MHRTAALLRVLLDMYLRCATGVANQPGISDGHASTGTAICTMARAESKIRVRGRRRDMSTNIYERIARVVTDCYMFLQCYCMGPMWSIAVIALRRGRTRTNTMAPAGVEDPYAARSAAGTKFSVPSTPTPNVPFFHVASSRT